MEGSMRLILKRLKETRQGFAWFRLDYRLELTNEEKQLSDRYSMPTFRGFWNDNIGINDGHLNNAFGNGDTRGAGDVYEIMQFEKELRDRCDALHTYWAVAEAYRGCINKTFHLAARTA